MNKTLFFFEQRVVLKKSLMKIKSTKVYKKVDLEIHLYTKVNNYFVTGAMTEDNYIFMCFSPIRHDHSHLPWSFHVQFFVLLNFCASQFPFSLLFSLCTPVTLSPQVNAERSLQACLVAMEYHSSHAKAMGFFIS